MPWTKRTVCAAVNSGSPEASGGLSMGAKLAALAVCLLAAALVAYRYYFSK